MSFGHSADFNTVWAQQLSVTAVFYSYSILILINGDCCALGQHAEIAPPKKLNPPNLWKVFEFCWQIQVGTMTRVCVLVTGSVSDRTADTVRRKNFQLRQSCVSVSCGRCVCVENREFIHAGCHAALGRGRLAWCGREKKTTQKPSFL